ncbi:Protein MAINTENANCE OF MERISTEMS [Glycine soja]
MVDAATGAETDAHDIGDEPEGFPGGPRDPSVLTEYADHVAASERPELKLSSYGRKVHHLGRPVPAIADMVAGTRLSPLIACSIDTEDHGLISSFVDRWHRETSSFHLPVGEISITLDDVATLLLLLIVGALHDFQPLCIDEVGLLLVELLMVSSEVAMAETGQCGGPYALRDLTLAGQYAWGAAGLVHMFDQLNDCWIYEHFPSVMECNADPDYDEVSPRACRWIATKKTVKKVSTATYRQRLDHLRIPHVCWMPYSEHRPVQDFHLISCFFGQVRWGPVVVRYRPERVMPQFGCVQCIPAHPVHPWVAYNDIDDMWTHYSDHLATAGDPCVEPGQCVPNHIDWFFCISHPFMIVAQPSDPPADAPQVPELDIPQVSDDLARSDVDEPRHVVEACDAIAKRLERHLSLKIVTPGTSTHEVIEECLKIVKSVTQDRIVYVRSQRRRYMDQP